MAIPKRTKATRNKKVKATQNKAAKTETPSRLKDLKARAYDLLATIDNLQQQLRQINAQIARESNRGREPTQ